MARPREFDEAAALDAAAACFWTHGYEATSVRDLAQAMGITCASLYNAFGDKLALYHKALDHYVGQRIAERVACCRALPPRQALEVFFAEAVARSLEDPDHKGCLLVNAAVDAAPRDPGSRAAVAAVLERLELFFRQCIEAGQADASISSHLPAADLARHFLGLLIGLRVLARVRPERSVLEGMLRPGFALLDGDSPPGRSPESAEGEGQGEAEAFRRHRGGRGRERLGRA